MSEDFEDLSDSDFDNLSTAEKLQIAEELNSKAELVYQQKDLKQAMDISNNAIKQLNYTFPESEQERAEFIFLNYSLLNRVASILISKDKLSDA